MDILDGIWRLVDSRAWSEQGARLPAPYGERPLGQLTFSNGRMLAALCKADPRLGPNEARAYSSYGGPYTFDGTTLETTVDIASDATRIGGRQTREVVRVGDTMILRPPTRRYGDAVQRRELLWQRVWQPGEPEALAIAWPRSEA